jgi:hypothetical protein
MTFHCLHGGCTDAPDAAKPSAPTGARGATMHQKKERAMPGGKARSSFVLPFRKLLRYGFGRA